MPAVKTKPHQAHSFPPILTIVAGFLSGSIEGESALFSIFVAVG